MHNNPKRIIAETYPSTIDLVYIRKMTIFILLTISLNDIIYSQTFSKKALHLRFAKNFAKCKYFAK